MSNYDIIYLERKAKQLGFIRDTFEKVSRLADILEYVNTNPLLRNDLALKGGTAINLTIFDLPRLSVDLDFDYIIPNSKEEMLENRRVINLSIDRYMLSEGYMISPKTKNPHSLDSWVYEYTGSSGNHENIKLEINYSLRSHVFEAEIRTITTGLFPLEHRVKCLAPVEIYGSKINALLTRAAARDLYDVRNMIQHSLFDKSTEEILRKCIVFYAAISAKKINKFFDTNAIDSITNRIIKTDLLPVIKKDDDFELESAKKLVKEFISYLMVLTKDEREFLEKFENGQYLPELLFEDRKILERLKNHPMATWKTRRVN